MNKIEVNSEVTITVTFRDYDSQGATGDPIDPTTVVANVFLSDGSIVVSEAATTRVSVGEYSYTWTPTEVGDYVVEIVGTFPSSTTVVPEDFTVVEQLTPVVVLGEDEEFVFATEVSPLYADPEEFKLLFPEATLVEIMEIIHKFSLELDKLYKGKEIDLQGYEYLQAAVECSLSRTYEMDYGGSGGSITLGDLSVENGPRFTGTLNRGNVANPCEYAFVLRTELIRYLAGPKGFIKSARRNNPMPSRKLRHQSSYTRDRPKTYRDDF